MQIIALTIAPAIALIWFFYARNRYRPESKALITALFILGGLTAGIALILNQTIEKYTSLWPGAQGLDERLIFWIGGIGLNEELAKMIVLLAVLYPRRDFRLPYQGLLGAATVAMGFASVENLVYLERYGTMTVLIRSFLTVPAHAFFSIPMGILMAYAKRADSTWHKYLLLVAALGAAALLHGAYDAWLSFPSPWLNSMAYVQVLAMAYLTYWLMRIRPPEKQPPHEVPTP